ncbi:MAG: PAS domain S-box protein [Planctomycetia bacterium]|nr:PAS domain S-box protein [Planctomycetia bacterium]
MPANSPLADPRRAVESRYSMLLIAGAGLALALLVVNISLTYRNTRQLQADTLWVAHTHEVIGGLENVLSLAKDAETGMRGYIISREPEYLEPYNAAVVAIDKQVDNVQRLTKDNPQQQAQFPELRQHLTARLKVLQEALALIEKGQFDANRQKNPPTGRGKQEMDALRGVIGEMIEHERGLLRDRLQISQQTYQTAVITGLLTGISALAAITGFLILVRRFLAARSKAAFIIAEQAERLRTTLASIGDAVITTDMNGCISNMNAVAESLTGWTNADAVGLSLDVTFHIVNEETRQPVSNPAMRALKEGVVVGLANHTILISKDGTERPIDDSAAPIRCKEGVIVGCVLVFRDITERRRADEALRNRERQFRTLADSIPQLAWMASPNGEVFWYNRRWFEFTGTTLEQMAGWGWQSVHDPHELSRVLDKWKESIATARPFEMVFPLKGQDGEYRQFLTLVRPLLDEQGQVVRWFGTNTDVTEAKRAEEEVRESRSRLESTLVAGEVGTWEFDIVHNIVRVDKNLAFMLGMPEKAGTGGPIEEYMQAIHPDDRPRVAEVIERATQSGERYEVEFRLVAPDSTIRWMVARGRIEQDATGRAVQMPGVVVDVTQRRLAEDDRHKFVTLAETITDFVGMCDLSGKAFYVNDAGMRMVGLDSLAQLQNTPVQEFFFPEDQQTILHEFFPAVLEKGDGEIEVRFRHFKTGHAIWMLYKVVALTDFQGSRVGLATVSRDITQRRQLEDNLRQLASDLSESSRRKDEFLATLAHELRNPLAPIRNGLQLMKLAQGDAQSMEHARALMERQLVQLVRLVDDLLDVSRITRGKIDLRRERVDLASIIQQAVETSRPAIEMARQALTVTLPPQPMFLHGDAVRLVQVFSNLLNNSCKYSEPEGHITVTAKRHDKQVVVSIKDTGIGIPAEMLPRIFEMFTQIDQSLGRSGGGLGIGLTLVQRLVELHNGSVSAASAGAGHGSEFTVRLPILEDEPQPLSGQEAGEPSVTSGRRILVVDDNRDSASSLAMLLKLTGNETQTAFDGLAALEAAENFQPDAVLLDIGLPQLNGYEVAQKIREQAWGKNMVLIALTGWGQDEDRQRSKEAGFNSHMVKPVDHAALAKLLADLLPVPG